MKVRLGYNEKRFCAYGVTFLSFSGIYGCIIPLIMLKILLFVLFIWVWWHFTLKDSNRDVVAWREKKYGKAVLLFILDNFVKVLLLSALFPIVALFLFVKLFID